MDTPTSITRKTQPVPQRHKRADPALSKTAKMGHVIAISSGKGGVGKSNISVNLSIALSQLGQKVCLFDADTNLANANILLGLKPQLTLHDFLTEKLDISEILTAGPGGIEIVPAASGIADFVHLNEPQQTHLLTALQDLETRFDYLILDTAAGIDETLINFLLAAPYTIITITPEPTSLTDAFSLLKVLRKRGFDQPVFIIVNMVTSLPSAHDAFKRFKGAVAKYLELELRYLGYILNDKKIPKSVRKQQAVLLRYPDALASRCIKGISSRLKQLMETQEEPGDSSFSDYFDRLTGPDLPLLEEEEDEEESSISETGEEPEPIWDRKALETLQELTPDEAENFLIEAILNWNEKTNDFPFAVQQCLLYCAKTSRLPEDQSQRLIQLLEHTISDIDPEESRKTRTPPQQPTQIEENGITGTSPLNTRPLESRIEENEVPGLLAALHYASLLSAKEHHTK